MKSKINNILQWAIAISLCYSILGYFYSKLELGMPIGSSSIVYVYVLLCLMVVFLRKSSNNMQIVRDTNEEKLLFLFFLSTIASLFASFQFSLTLNNIMYLLMPYISYSAGRYLSALHDNRYPTSIVMCASIVLMSIPVLSIYDSMPTELILNRDYTFAIFATIPYLFLIRWPSVRLISIVLAFMLILVSTKRSLIIALLPPIIIFYSLMIFKDPNKSLKYKIFSTFIIVALLFVGISALKETVDLSDNIQERFEDLSSDDGSGRGSIYDTIMTAVSMQSFLGILFGNGYDAVANNLLGHPAHNDFLEVLYNHGIIALGLWIAFIVMILKKTISFIKTNLPLGASLLSVIILWQMASFSNCVFVNYSISASFFLFFGLICGCCESGKLGEKYER